ncbi:MAG: 23S rRNA (uracil-5-)-methyltransferase RumA, partial [Clostridiales bacterium]|nr:23S rRNA (uracil-5-)-methyltransferase RumA [Clostridiales bacterium]
MDISYEEELALKKFFLKECLGEYFEFFKILYPAPRIEAYRNKMEFAFGDEGRDGALALGIRKKRSFYEVATPLDCVLIHDDFKIIVKYVLEFFRENGETFFHRKRHTGSLRHLVLRRGENTGEILVLLSSASTLKASLESFVDGLLALPLGGKIVGILHSQNDGVADAVKNENIRVLFGRDYYNEEICGLKFKISAFSFFQTNTSAAEVLYKIVRDCASSNSAGKDETALDLYCGTGTVAQIISKNFKKIVGVDIVEEAIL